MRDLNTILRSGYVRRWHCNPDLAHIPETLAEHQWRVAQIIMAYHDDPSKALIDAALCHDVAEVVTGDIPQPFKRENPTAAIQIGLRESAIMARLGIEPNLSKKEMAWITFADRLAAYLHVLHYRPDLLARDDWQAAKVEINAMAESIGIEWEGL